MSISLDQELGLHGYALELRSMRSQILAGNLANIETPGYQARDIDYQSIMNSVAQSLDATSQTDNSAVVSQPQVSTDDLLYRIPYQVSQDGNTAELGPEQTRFTQNAMDFQTSLTFLNMKISGLKEAIKGE
nr:flagellar basal body rod protein FlgB [uncultured Tolumonas sp.]